MKNTSMKGKFQMANQLKKTRTITDKVSVKGVLSDDGTVITYMNDKTENEITISECLKAFLGKPVDFSISIKSEDELPEEDNE